jgi:hypothetical protein
MTTRRKKFQHAPHKSPADAQKTVFAGLKKINAKTYGELKEGK